MHGAVRGERGVLAVLGQRDPEAAGVLEGAPHQPGGLDAATVVGEQPDTDAGQLGHRGQSLAGPADGDRPGHRHLGTGRLGQLEHVANRLGRVERRFGVGHRHHRRVTAEGRRPAAGLDGLGLLPSRLAEMSVQVDQAGSDETAAGVEDGGALRDGERRVRRRRYARP